MDVTLKDVILELQTSGLAESIYIKRLNEGNFDDKTLTKLYNLIREYKQVTEKVRNKPYILSNAKEYTATERYLNKASELRTMIANIIYYSK